ncbi:c-type cytochrome [Gemmatimonas groenlandica]|uniref:Cytochrome c n=1 Tax=Gemmatimonas groenlandica TaxID=2732249 RepID=A0A6M4IHE2_9BACT|nr:cytochrome c [Gemmatimonas groenlandica]QJR34524.1 cytochrome c [Gemmatimonas groenlandica]
MTISNVLPSAFLATVVAASVFGGSRMSAQRPLAVPPLRAAMFVADSAKLYTEAQAVEGAKVWTATCSGCHESKDVTSADFKTKWVGRSLFELYEQIRTTMPDDAPGTLTPEQYLTSVTYILKLNGLPAGETALVSDSATMSTLKFELPAPPPTSPLVP